MVVDTSFWPGKRVFVTGHTGFKGGWICLWLQQLGADLTGFALDPPTDPSLFELARVGDGMTSVGGDVRDLQQLRRVIEECQPEIIIHMAAQALVRHSYANPVETYATNVMGTVHVLEAARETTSVRILLNVTSDKCYENREWVWGYREDEPMGGHDPYSSSKGCAELVTDAYRRSYCEESIAVASARAGNVIGGGDWAQDRLVPDIVRAFMKEETVTIRRPHAIRPWQHVLEPVGGYLKLCQKLWEESAEYAEGWNFGPRDADAKPVSWIVAKMADRWGQGAAWRIDDGDHPYEAHHLKLDCSKAHSELEWQPRWSLDQGLDATVEWYRAFQAGADMHELTMRQIGAYSDCR